LTPGAGLQAQAQQQQAQQQETSQQQGLGSKQLLFCDWTAAI
jgi:hypothetical protein